MTSRRYLITIRKIDEFFTFLGYEKVKDTKEFTIYNCFCSEIIIPKRQVSQFLFFALFCQDEKVVEVFHSNEYRVSFLLNNFTRFVYRHIHLQKLKEF